jgi:hypothetical protein
MKIVDELPENAPDGELVWVMSAPAVGWQYLRENGVWYAVAGMNCPYIPRFLEENLPNQI